MRGFIGVDLGGTNTRVGLADENGLLRLERFPTQAGDGPQDWLKRLGDICAELKQTTAETGLEIGGLGLGTPGVLDRSRRVVQSSPNLPLWVGFALAAGVSQTCGLPTVIENDANLYALGENCFGAGRGLSDMACFTLGTGVGGGVILGGQILVGALGTGGELGHINVEPEGRLCGCGARGCLEAYASATGFKGMLAESLAQGRQTSLEPGDGVKKITEACEQGDPLAKDLMGKAGRALGRAINNLVATTGVELIVLGGGVAKSWPMMEEATRRELGARMRMVEASRIIITRSELEDTAPVLGAAVLARQQTEFQKVR